MAREPIAKTLGLGCTDHGCIWGHDGGMGTNGGCHCLMDDDRKTLRAANRAVRMMRQELAALRECAKVTATEHPKTARHAITAEREWDHDNGGPVVKVYPGDDE